MGRVLRKKVQSIRSVSKKSKKRGSGKIQQSNTISQQTMLKGNVLKKPVNDTNKPNEPNFNSSFEVIEIEDNSLTTSSFQSIDTGSSKVPISNVTSYDNDIIDITDVTFYGNESEKSQTVPPKVNILNNEDDIIDITDITIDSYEYEKSNKVSSDEKMPFCDDVQFISHTICTQNNPIELVTISDDSDEENTPNQQSYGKLEGVKSIKEHLGIIVNPKKRAYNSPLRNHKKMSKDNFIHQREPYNLGAFVIDKQRISHHSLNCNKFEPKTASFPQSHASVSSTTSLANKKLRPIIIDGLNIGHAHGVGFFSVKGIELCVKYFADRGHKEIIAFIPQHRQGPPGSESNTILNALLKKGHICYTPSRKVQNLRMTCYDDRIILNYANRCGGVVISNDNYRDLYEESEAFKEIIEQRQVMVTFVKDEIIVPDDQYNRRHDVRSLSDILCFSE